MQLWCGSVLCPSVATILRTAPSNPHHAASHEADTGMDTRTRELLQFLQEAVESALPGLNTKHAKCTLYLFIAYIKIKSITQSATHLGTATNSPWSSYSCKDGARVGARDSGPTRGQTHSHTIYTVSTQYLHCIYTVSTIYT